MHIQSLPRNPFDWIKRNPYLDTWGNKFFSFGTLSLCISQRFLQSTRIFIYPYPNEETWLDSTEWIFQRIDHRGALSTIGSGNVVNAVKGLSLFIYGRNISRLHFFKGRERRMCVHGSVEARPISEITFLSRLDRSQTDKSGFNDAWQVLAMPFYSPYSSLTHQVRYCDTHTHDTTHA